MLEGHDARGRLGWFSALPLLVLGAGCGAEAHQALVPASKPAPVVVKEAPRSVEVPEAPLLPLRSGTVEPVVHEPVTLVVTGRAESGGYEILALGWPALAALTTRTPAQGYEWVVPDTLNGATVTLEPALDAFAFVPPSRSEVEVDASKPLVWVRRKKSDGPVVGTLYANASWRRHGHRLPFRAELTAPKTPAATPARIPAPQVEAAWASAAIEYLEASTSPVWTYAAGRLRARYLPKEQAKLLALRKPQLKSGSELSHLMDTTTGRISVERALERDRDLFVAASREKPSIALDKLVPPRLSQHAWAAMSAGLGAPPDEPLAHATPAEFYFVRAKDFGKLIELIDLVDDFGQPAADLLDGQTQSRGTLARYETELGLSRSALTRTFGPALVKELAVVGSDPYVHEGTDLTLLFRVKDARLFGGALAATLAQHAVLHPGITESTFVEGGVTVTVRRSADGRIRQHRATLGDLELVSNSAAAIRRVLATRAGKQPSLADEPDFRYMLARDATTPNDELLYMGDRFVATVVGPAQKIAEARRQLALGELLTPGYAALTYGLLNGRSPTKTSELVQAKLLDARALRHADGAAVDWEPGRAARSVWGTPALLEPLLDRPAVTVVRDAERRGYEEFARAYEREWSDRIDPIALRLHTEPVAAGKQELVADLRILPTLRREYAETMRTVGNVHLDVPRLLPGFGALIGLGEDASFRRDLSNSIGFFGLREPIKFDWLGDYAVVGTTSRNEVPNALHPLLPLRIELPEDVNEGWPDRRVLESLVNLPVYAAFGVKSRLGAGVFLTAVRKMAREAAPGVATWSDAAPYRGNDVVAVSTHEHDVNLTLYYALTANALVLSFNEAVLHRVIDQLTDRPPRREAKGAASSPDSGQVVQELSGAADSALYRVFAWFATRALVESASMPRELAASFLLGTRDLDPQGSDALMRAYLGTVTVTPEGRSYVLAPDGTRDPLRGTLHAPAYPDLPVPGSPVERVLTRLARLRSSLSFDDEPALATPTLSFHARARLELR
jgi:hypothetical protein